MNTQENQGSNSSETRRSKIMKHLNRLATLFVPSESDVESVESTEARIERQKRLREHMQNLWLRR